MSDKIRSTFRDGRILLLSTIKFLMNSLYDVINVPYSALKYSGRGVLFYRKLGTN